MGQRSQQYAAVMNQAIVPWYEGDAQYVWSSTSDTDTAAVDPIIGGQLIQKSASPAAISGSLWDMTSANYNSSTGFAATVDLSKPFLFALVVDKNNQASSTARLVYVGNEATDSVSFGSGSTSSIPEFRFYMAGALLGPGAFLTQATWSAKGTVLVHWLDYDPNDASNTVLAGTNSTTYTFSGVLTVPTGRTLTRNLTYGNSSGTTGLSAIKQGLTQFVSRAGMTRTDKANIIAKMRAQAGI